MDSADTYGEEGEGARQRALGFKVAFAKRQSNESINLRATIDAASPPLRAMLSLLAYGIFANYLSLDGTWQLPRTSA